MATSNDNYKQFTLDNGLVVALQNTPTQTISGRLRVNHGGLHEKKGEEGLAHFLEHVLINSGGKKFSPVEVEKIMGTFGNINAFTSASETCFPVGMLAEDLELYLDFISDVAFHPRLDLEIVNQERQRVLRELADNRGNNLVKDRKDYSDALYGINSPQFYEVLGEKNVIEKAMPEDLRTFHERGYNSDNMDLILVGALSENVKELIFKYFSDKPRGAGSKYNFLKNPDLERQIIIHKSAKELLNAQDEQGSSANLKIGFVAPSDDEDDYYAANALVTILGGKSDSKLFKKISQELGLAYSIGSSYITGNNVGTINIEGSVQATQIDKVIDAIFKEMDYLKTNLVDVSELSTLNRNMIYGLEKYHETNDGLVDTINHKLNTGMNRELLLQKMNEVTPELIRDAANKYFPTTRKDGKYVLFLKDPLKK